MRAKWLSVLPVGVITLTVGASEDTYLGQAPPGLTPRIFAPGIISLEDRDEQNITFSPDGKECYFTVSAPNWSSSWIMMSGYRHGEWSKPKKALFSNERSLSPSISPDGTRLLFSSNRGTEGRQAIWQCTRTAEGGWSQPVEMDRQVSSTADEWSCHLSDLGNVFVCSWRSGGEGKCDGWRIPCVDGQCQEAKDLTVMNTGGSDCGVAPGPKESYVIFQSDRPEGQGGVDLYLSSALPKGGWTSPRNLGPKVNSDKIDAGPWISFDGRYLFFSSNRAGSADIYWVETRAFLPDTKECGARDGDTGKTIDSTTSELE